MKIKEILNHAPIGADSAFTPNIYYPTYSAVLFKCNMLSIHGMVDIYDHNIPNNVTDVVKRLNSYLNSRLFQLAHIQLGIALSLQRKYTSNDPEGRTKLTYELSLRLPLQDIHNFDGNLDFNYKNFSWFKKQDRNRLYEYALHMRINKDEPYNMLLNYVNTVDLYKLYFESPVNNRTHINSFGAIFSNMSII